MAGLCFEEFEEGQVFEHAISRTVTEMDNVLFSTLTMNPQPLHLDEEFAKHTEFGQRLVNSLFTLGLVIGISVGETTLGTTVANLGMSDVRFPKPVFHGDTLRARTIVKSKRRSKSRGDAGIVEFEHQGINQRGETVAICRRAGLMKCRSTEGGMRSLLFVPADSERKLSRAPQFGADALILDLEDSGVPANRTLARDQARDFLAAGSAEFRRYVRINPLSSGVALDDLAAVVPRKPDGILLPKCVPEDLRTLDHYLSALEAASALPPGSIRVIAIATETPAAMFTLGGYGGVSSRLEAITWGAEDLAACIGGNNRRVEGVYDDVYLLARSLCLLGAAAAGVAAIDTIYTDFKDDAGLAAECAAARRSGFTAKMAIHPAQIPTINRTFAASD